MILDVKRGEIIDYLIKNADTESYPSEKKWNWTLNKS